MFAADLAERLRPIMEREAGRVPEPSAVLISSGIDSLVVGAAMKAVGKQPVGITFSVAGRPSKDVKGAQKACQALGADWRHIELSPDLEALDVDVRAMVGDGLRGKAEIECSWPMRKALDYCSYTGIKGVASGVPADGYFVLSKSGLLHHRGTVELMDKFRATYWARPTVGQLKTTAAYAESVGVTYIAPFAAPDMLPVFQGCAWDTLNKPRQKEPLRLLYPGIERTVRPQRHLSYQSDGTSGITGLFTELAESRGYKSSIGYFNALARELGSGVPAIEAKLF